MPYQSYVIIESPGGLHLKDNLNTRSRRKD
jgi:hypothetical protein